MDVIESRQEERFTLNGRVEGNLAGVDVVLVDLGPHGAKVRHSSALKLGVAGKLAFELPDTREKVAINGYVIWSRIAARATPEGERPYHSGVRLEDPEGKMEAIIRRLADLSLASRSKDSIQQKVRAHAERERSKRQPGIKFFGGQAPRIPGDVILLVRQTRQRLQANPEESVKWLNRAKYSLDASGSQVRHRDDVIAVWEYLERSVELDIIARILNTK
jgi:hypothetical protein